MSRLTSLLVFFSAAALGCSHASDSASPSCAESEMPWDGACVPRFDGCDETSIPIAGGGCAPSGLSSCPDGFSLDGARCIPVLPVDECPRGMMAVPGETVCRAVAPCPAGEWYDAPATALHVDAKASGAGADGSVAHPFATIRAALDAATDGATIALADGSYREAVAITKKISLIGRCPTKASIDAPDDSTITFDVQAPATIARVGITGPGLGISVFETEGVVVDQVWIHDGGSVAFDVERRTKIGAAKLSRSLIENVDWAGVVGIGGDIEVEASVVRDVNSVDATRRGIGMVVRPEGDRKGSLRVKDTVVERVHQFGIASQGGPFTATATVVRRVSEDVELGLGILSMPEGGKALDAPIETKLDGVVVEEVTGVGVLIDHSDVDLARLVVRAIHPGTKKDTDGEGVGTGIAVQRSTAHLREVFVEGASRSGIAVINGSATIERALVRDIASVAGIRGFGVYVGDDVTKEPANVTLRDLRVARSTNAGLMVIGAHASVERALFDDVRGDDGYGDGVSAGGDWAWAPDFVRGTVALDSVYIGNVPRAGLVAFGGGDVTVARTAFRCNGFDMEINEMATTLLSSPVSLVDQGGSSCGCDGAEHTCRAQSSNLKPVPPQSKQGAH